MAPIPLSAATSILLAYEGIWHPLNQSLGAAIEPSFSDPQQLDPDTGQPVIITPGDNWVQFVDSASGLIYAAPFRSIAAVQLAAAQAPAVANLIRGAARVNPELAAAHAELLRPAE